MNSVDRLEIRDDLNSNVDRMSVENEAVVCVCVVGVFVVDLFD